MGVFLVPAALAAYHQVIRLAQEHHTPVGLGKQPHELIEQLIDERIDVEGSR